MLRAGKLEVGEDGRAGSKRDSRSRRIRRLPGDLPRDLSGGGIRAARLPEEDAENGQNRFGPGPRKITEPDSEPEMKRQTYESVWDALEESAEAAANMRVRADLMIAVQRYVSKNALTQLQAAKRLGITQPRLNDLLRGKIDKFSVDALVNMLTKVGKQVSVKVSKAA